MNETIIDKSYNGVLIVKARNGNFNAGFDGNPRTLPDGTIFATDKALKYCIREYLAEFHELPIFVRRSRRVVGEGNTSKLMYQLLEENFFSKLKMLVDRGQITDSDTKKNVSEWVKNHLKDIKNFEDNSTKVGTEVKKKFSGFLENDKEVVSILKNFIDVRLFGIVFAVKGNVSLTGPVQISYGINKLEESSPYSVQILSPYRNPKAKTNKDEEGKEKQTAQTAIGEETRADEVYYAYNISVNKNSAKQTGMTTSDLKLFKQALMNSVDPITSCTKYGCESIALIWLNNKKNIVLNNLDEFVDLDKAKDGHISLELTRLKEYLVQYGFEKIEKQEHKFDSDSGESENQIQLIYKKGKIDLTE